MRDPKEKVSELARTLHESSCSFFSINARMPEHITYGKQVHEPSKEVRVLGYEHRGIGYSIRKLTAKTELRFMAKYSHDEKAREMARKELEIY